MSFAVEFQVRREKWGPFCLGVDPTSSILESWSLTDSLSGLNAFCEIVLEAVDVGVSVVKPQLAYFERFGFAGLAVLSEFVRQCRSRGSLVLLDGKRGDISSTAVAFAQAFLGQASPFQADAMTAHPYMGVRALHEMCAFADKVGGCIFVVVLPSNTEGRAIHHARVSDGRTVAEMLADDIALLNNTLSPGSELGPVGAVIGANADEARGLGERMPRSLLLAPGIGTQGASLTDVARQFRGFADRVIPTAARSILREGPDLSKLRGAIISARSESHALLPTFPAETSRA